jgi:hypothetical protein
MENKKIPPQMNLIRKLVEKLQALKNNTLAI